MNLGRILLLGSTIQKTLFGNYRALRVNDDGILEVNDVGKTASSTQILGATVLTASYNAAQSSWFNVEGCHQVAIDITTSVATPNNIEIQPRWSADGGTTFFSCPVTNNIVNGVQEVTDLELLLIGSGGAVVPLGGHTVLVRRPKKATHMRFRFRDPGVSGVSIVVNAALEV